LNARLEPASLPLVFHPLDGNFWIAFLHSPAATSPAEHHLRDNNTFRLHGKSEGCHNPQFLREFVALAPVTERSLRRRGNVVYLYLQKAQEKTSRSAFRISEFAAGASSHPGGA
jgi:hypothetical protein